MDFRNVKVVVLDIEGTVCPISFVRETLFPYALSALPSILETQWDSPNFAAYRNAFPAEYRNDPTTLSSHVHSLMASDIKAPYLKSLQGYLWLTGYQSGLLKCPLFADVHPALASWKARGLDIVIYSSGSVAAQKLLFQYTNCEPGDLRGLLSDYFDTVNAGMKTEKDSYTRIEEAYVQSKGVNQSEGGYGKYILFLSDNVKEIIAAKEAGWQAVVVVREGNAPLTKQEKEAHQLISSFEEIKLEPVGNVNGGIPQEAEV